MKTIRSAVASPLLAAKAIATAALPFTELKKRALIDPAAQAANDAPDFSRRIRERLLQ